MNKRVNPNRFKPKSTHQPFNTKKWLIGALILLIILFFFEILKPNFHASSPVLPVQTPLPSNTSDTPTFDFYQVLPKVSLASVNLDNIATTTKPVSTAPQLPKLNDSNATYTLQFASFKDVDQATALATKINAVKGLGSHQAQVVISTKGSASWYIVKIGPFATSQDAQDIQDILDRYYYSGRIFTNQK